MNEAGADNAGKGPEQYLKPGEHLLRVSEHVGIKKFIFTAYITDRRVFLIDRNEKKPGVTSKELPREVIISSILESTGDSDPFLVLGIRTTEDEVRTMKIAFISEGDDRVPEIGEWINLLHGRPARSAKTQTKEHKTQFHPRDDVPDKVGSHEKVLHEEEARVNSQRVYPVSRHEMKEIPENHESPAEQSPVPAEAREIPDDHLEISFCHHCGKRVLPGANFCSYCGTKLHRSRTLPVSRVKKRELHEE